MYGWSGSRPLASGTPSVLDVPETPLGYPAVSLSDGDPVTVVPQSQSFHVLPQAIVIDGVDVGVCQLKAPDVGLGVADLVILATATAFPLRREAEPALLHPSHQG